MSPRPILRPPAATTRGFPLSAAGVLTGGIPVRVCNVDNGSQDTNGIPKARNKLSELRDRVEEKDKMSAR